MLLDMFFDSSKDQSKEEPKEIVKLTQIEDKLGILFRELESFERNDYTIESIDTIRKLEDKIYTLRKLYNRTNIEIEVNLLELNIKLDTLIQAVSILEKLENFSNDEIVDKLEKLDKKIIEMFSSYEKIFEREIQIILSKILNKIKVLEQEIFENCEEAE